MTHARATSPPRSARPAMALGLLIVLVLPCLGCPIPIPRSTVLQPKVTLQVQDPAGNPVAGAPVAVTLGSQPHSRRHHTRVFITDRTGHVGLEEIRKTKWVMPLMLHGVPQYFWEICISTPQGEFRRRFYLRALRRHPIHVLRVSPTATPRPCARVDPERRP